MGEISPQTWLPALISLGVVYTSTHKCCPPYSSLFLIGSLRKAKKILKTPASITWINTHRNTMPLQEDDITQLYTLVANSSIYLKGHKLYMRTAHPWNVQCVECLRPCSVLNMLIFLQVFNHMLPPQLPSWIKSPASRRKLCTMEQYITRNQVYLVHIRVCVHIAVFDVPLLNFCLGSNSYLRHQCMHSNKYTHEPCS